MIPQQAGYSSGKDIHNYHPSLRDGIVKGITNITTKVGQMVMPRTANAAGNWSVQDYYATQYPEYSEQTKLQVGVPTKLKTPEGYEYTATKVPVKTRPFEYYAPGNTMGVSSNNLPNGLLPFVDYNVKLDMPFAYTSAEQTAFDKLKSGDRIPKEIVDLPSRRIVADAWARGLDYDNPPWLKNKK